MPMPVMVCLLLMPTGSTALVVDAHNEVALRKDCKKKGGICKIGCINVWYSPNRYLGDVQVRQRLGLVY